MKPELFECKPLKARLTPLACLTNRLKAMALLQFQNIGPGLLRPCVKCPTGRRVRAYLPGDA